MGPSMSCLNLWIILNIKYAWIQKTLILSILYVALLGRDHKRGVTLTPGGVGVVEAKEMHLSKPIMMQLGSQLKHVLQEQHTVVMKEFLVGITRNKLNL